MDYNKREVPGGYASSGSPRKKPRKAPLKWSEELHRDFVSAIFEIGINNASPTVIRDQMMTKDNEITSERVKSHLQKYRVHRDRSKAEFMAEYDASMRRIKERGGAHWYPTDKFSSGDVAASLAYYTMNPEAEMSMPFDMRRSAVAAANNMPKTAAPSKTSKPSAASKKSTGPAHQEDGAMFSDHQTTAGMSNMQPNSAMSISDAIHDHRSRIHSTKEGATIFMPSLTSEEYNSPLGTTLRYLTGLCNSMTDHLLEIRNASSSSGPDPPEHTLATSSTDGNPMSSSYPSSYNNTHFHHQGPYPPFPHPAALPIHPQGYMPPGPLPPPHAPSYGYPLPHFPPPNLNPHHGPASYPQEQYLSSSSNRPTSTTHDDAANTQADEGSSKYDPSIKAYESNATPLYESQRVGASTSEYGAGGGGGGSGDGSSRAAADPDKSKSRSSPMRNQNDDHHTHYHRAYPNNSPPNHSWFSGYIDNGSMYSNNNGYSKGNAFSFSLDGGGGGSGGEHKGQRRDSNNRSPPGHHAPSHGHQYNQGELSISPTSKIGSSNDLGDPWDDVPYSPIAR